MLAGIVQHRQHQLRSDPLLCGGVYVLAVWFTVYGKVGGNASSLDGRPQLYFRNSLSMDHAALAPVI